MARISQPGGDISPDLNDADDEAAAMVRYDACVNALSAMYGPKIQSAVLAWCSEHHFSLYTQASDHVIFLKHNAKNGARSPMRASTSHDDTIDKDEKSSAISNIFAVSMGTAARKEQKRAEPNERCDICSKIARRVVRETSDAFANAIATRCSVRCVSQQLLLCPDCILARCAEDALDECVGNYVVVLCAPLYPSPILNLRGDWCFEFVQRMHFNRMTLEGFVAFRTYVICNMARIKSADRTIDEGTEPKKPGICAQVISRALFRGRQLSSKAEARKTKCKLDPKESRGYFMIRQRIKGGIMLRRADTFADAMRIAGIPISFDVDDFERAINNVFIQEPHLVYSEAIFEPNLREVDNTCFNYWRGWSSAVSCCDPSPSVPLAKNESDSVAPERAILAFINRIWASAPSDEITDTTRYIISWFAHIIQKPGEQPARQLLFHGFARDTVATLLRFIGHEVIGRQYYDEYPTATADRSVAQTRDDCLLSFLDECPLSDVEAVMRESRGLWLARETPRDARSKLHPQPILRVIDGAPGTRHKYMRIAVCMSDLRLLPIAHERRRFITLESLRRDAHVPNAQSVYCAQLNDALMQEHCAARLFALFAHWQPLHLNWDV